MSRQKSGQSGTQAAEGKKETPEKKVSGETREKVHMKYMRKTEEH
ncbi:hypothetical protein IMSAG013_01158 [Clostridiales bacterium]|nr:hypothetical protein IMSAG013_01158 [Clostridiales bacterium]